MHALARGAKLSNHEGRRGQGLTRRGLNLVGERQAPNLVGERQVLYLLEKL